MEIVVRDAREEDINPIHRMGRADDAFRVSDGIPFYEASELREWIANPKDNILCVATANGDLAGFLFCKVISHHWAMLDNFYAAPIRRGNGIGTAMLVALDQRLQARGIEYLTTLIEEGRPDLEEWMLRKGFARAKPYRWFERFV